MKHDYHKKKSLEIALRRLVSLDKITPVFKYLGCLSVVEFKTQLTRRFVENMTFDNYGKIWTIDHIVPQAMFNLADDVDTSLCYNWRNLLPMLKQDNHIKEHCPVIAHNLIVILPESSYKVEYLKRLEPLIHLYEKYEDAIRR